MKEKYEEMYARLKTVMHAPLEVVQRFIKDSEGTKDFEAFFYPHGKCECVCGTCAESKGPAAYWVLREAASLKVCTRCILSSDDILEMMLSTRTSPVPYVVWDSIGALRLALELGQKEGLPDILKEILSEEAN